jgi:hypothetical protein
LRNQATLDSYGRIYNPPALAQTTLNRPSQLTPDNSTQHNSGKIKESFQQMLEGLLVC